jgi:hypothetical protein
VITGSASQVRATATVRKNAVINGSTDVLAWLRKQLEVDGNGLMREIVRSFAEGPVVAETDVACRAPYGVDLSRPDEPPQRLPDPTLGHPGGVRSI